MATIKFRLREVKKETYPILVRLIVGYRKEYQSKTEFSINPKYWDNKTNLPKGNTEDIKLLKGNLKKLDSYLESELNKSLGNGVLIDKYWLDEQIVNCFNRKEKTDNSILTNYIQHIIDNANTKKIIGTNRVGLSKGRIRSYNTFLNLINTYQEESYKKQIHLLDINKPFVDKFTIWLMNTKKYSDNYSGKVLSNLKTVCRDAKNNLIEVNEYSTRIEVFKEKKEDRIIQILSFDELEKLKEVKLEGAKDNARNLFVVGCYLGQRVGDLMKLNKSNLRIEQNYLFVDLVQEKTRKSVTIPVYDEFVKNILLNKFPYSIEPQKFNVHIKDVCELAKIDSVVSGRKTNSKIKRKELGKFPKYKLITSHCMRRSFASNHYGKMKTPLIIAITGHSREEEFLKYIGVPEDKDTNAKEFLRQLELHNNSINKESQLKAV